MKTILLLEDFEDKFESPVKLYTILDDNFSEELLSSLAALLSLLGL
jgi:hypothetical protein